MKIKNILAAGFTLVSCLASTQAVASWQPDKFSFGFGRDLEDRRLTAEALRLAVQWNLSSTPLKRSGWILGTHVTGSFNQWSSKLDPELASTYGAQKIVALAVLPGFRLALPKKDYDFYVDFGIGIGLLSDRALKKNSNSPVDKSTDFNFEIAQAIGLKFGPQKAYSLSWQYLHYSNAGIKEPNEGLDFQVLNLGFKF